jgi:hypothetical protein
VSPLVTAAGPPARGAVKGRPCNSPRSRGIRLLVGGASTTRVARRIGAALWTAVFATAAWAGDEICVGDCDEDGTVAVHELISCVRIPLGHVGLASCPPADRSRDGKVTVDELIAAVGSSIAGCGGGAVTPTETPAASTTPTPSATPSSTPTPTEAASSPVPTERDALEAWLSEGSYLGWASESAPHPSAGPHFGTVRVFLNDALFESLDAGMAEHPAGAAAVKELYGSGSTLQGWSVIVKVAAESDGGRGWYWYEGFGSVRVAGVGVSGCSGCHSLGRDYVRIPFPLQ